MSDKRDILNIVIGTRHRKDMGDIAGLAASIAEVGLLHPIVIRPDGRLVAGERRLQAARHLGWAEIAVTVIDIEAIARGELAENAARKDFTPSEQVAIAEAIEEVERRSAQERMLAGKPSAESAQGQTGETRQKVAARVGTSHDSLAKAKAVVAAAKAEPEKFGKLAEDMDRTGNVNGPFKRLKIAKASEAIRAEPPPLPGRGPYRVIVADPPWPYEIRDQDPSHRAVLPYPTMTIGEIKALDVAGIAHKDCILWLWTTNHYMRQAYEILDAWGFQDKTILTWAKNNFGFGDWLRGQTEHCIMAVRGKPTVKLTNESTLLTAPVGAHSAKPDAFYELVERLCPAPIYAELFSRRPRPKWEGHGNEATRAA